MRKLGVVRVGASAVPMLTREELLGLTRLLRRNYERLAQAADMQTPGWQEEVENTLNQTFNFLPHLERFLDQ